MQGLKRWHVGIGIGGIFLLVLTAALTGIIGNSAYALVILSGTYVQTYALVPLEGWILKIILVGSWLLFAIIILLLVILACALTFLVWKLNNALKMTTEFVTFDKILLHCLAGLATVKDQKQQEEKMKKILQVLLKNAMSSKVAAGHLFRASVLLPDSANPQYLKIWESEGMSPKNIERTAFYIGNDENKVKKERGVAGATYMDGKIRVAHMVKKGDKWGCEHDGYIHFENRTITPYRAFVSVPIVKVPLNRSEKQQRETIGVVCFDSHNKWIFDNPKAQTLLEWFGERVGDALSIYWELRAG
jgi:hypothetical protein